MVAQHPEYRTEFNKTIDYLKRTPGDEFHNGYPTTQPYTATFPAVSDEPFYACSVHYLPFPDAQKEYPFELESWIWMPQDHVSAYLLTYVPANKFSTEALSQLLLSSFAQQEPSANG